MDIKAVTVRFIEKRVFDLGDVLGTITVQSFSQNRQGLMSVMGFMCAYAGGKPSLARCGEKLLTQFPQFKSKEFLESLDMLNTILNQIEDNDLYWQFKNDWLRKQRDLYGDVFEVESFPRV